MDTMPLLCTRIRQVLYIIVQRRESMVNNFVTLCSIYIFIDLYKKKNLFRISRRRREKAECLLCIKSNFDAWYFKVCAKTT